MLDGKAYLKIVSSVGLTGVTCPHCGASTQSASGNDTLCNFCEQYINVPDAEIQKEKGAEIAFLDIHSAAARNEWDAATQKVEQLLKGSADPRLFYLSALFYKQLSDLKFFNRDYGKPGFMEDNANNIRTSLDLTFKWKEYFYKTIRLINDEIKRNTQMEKDILFIKFMSQIKLHRLVDASRTLKVLTGTADSSPLNDYANMVYEVEINAKGAEASLLKQLNHNEMNAFYYLAEHLAKEKKLDIASALLQKLNERTNLFMARELLNKVASALEASKM